MPKLNERDPINLDYRILTLILFCATRADLLAQYLTDNPKSDDRWPKLKELGLPLDMLDDARYLFALPKTQKALSRLQLVTQTLVDLYDYCDLNCPSDEILVQIAKQASLLSEPLQQAGKEAA